MRSVDHSIIHGLVLPALTVLPLASLQAAETVPPVATAGASSFTSADFARFAPRTALDMVQRIPGFIIAEGEDRRGLGQGGDNVLINGQRITGKSVDAIDALSRISAADVSRIDVVDAATLDVPGLSGRVANVIAATDGISGQLRWSPRFRLRRTDPRLLDGEITLNGRSGRLDYSLSLSNASQRNGNAGFETVYDGAGNFTDRRFEVLSVDEDRPRVSVTLKHSATNGNVANLSAAYERFYFTLGEDSDRIDRSRDFRRSEREWNAELNGDYEFALGPGRLKLIGLYRVEHSPFRNMVRFVFKDGSGVSGDRFLQTADEEEKIARAEYGWKSGSNDWQVAIEGAFNSLDNEASLASLDATGAFVPVPLPNASARVFEKRGEASVSFVRPLSDALTLQASLAGEYSRLTQSGPAGLTRTFVRPKGFLSIAWKASPRLDIRARVERAVGQLNFFDFVASTDISAGNSDAGNPNLVPEQSWRAELEATRSLGGFGTATAKLYAHVIEDIVDIIPVGATGESPGNVDRATAFGIEWNSTFTLDPLGWRGARVDIDANIRRTRLDDPLTGRPRPISEEDIRFIEIEFRQDIPATDWAYGWNFAHVGFSKFVRLGEIGRFTNSPGTLDVFIEHKDIAGFKVKATAGNLLGINEGLRRTVFVGRRDGPALFTEDRSRFYGPVFSFDISRSF
jgi:hypothetical protein